jgi:PEGA domain
MKKHAALLVLFCIASASALLSGCATIVKGTTQIIPVSSDPTGARVTVDNSPAGTTPTTVTLSRKQNHMVVIEKEGFAAESIAVTKSMGGAVAGNIIAGGLIGWGVDAMTGAQYNLAPNTISVRLSTKADQPASASAAANKTKEFIDELNKLDALLVDKKISPEEYGKMRAALVAKFQN